MAKFDLTVRGGRVIDEDDWTLQDSLGATIKSDKRLRPVLALRAGQVHRARSPLLAEQVPEVA